MRKWYLCCQQVAENVKLLGAATYASDQAKILRCNVSADGTLTLLVEVAQPRVHQAESVVTIEYR
jgi:hypothetical protein